MTTFEFNNATYKTNHKNYFTRIVDGVEERMPKADFMPIYEAYTAEQKALAEQTKPEASAPADPEPTPTPEAPKTRKHPTADAFLADIPKDKYIFKVNAKGHIRIFKTQEACDNDKACYVKLNPLKDGVWVLPRKDLRAARADIAWEEKDGWASKYAYKAADWNEVATILGF